MTNYLELMKTNKSYVSAYKGMPIYLQAEAKKLLTAYENSTDQKEKEELLGKLFGTYNPRVFLGEGFRCDYGFNIHFHGFTVINYNVVMLDTSPIHIGDGTFIAPGVCIACAGHAILAEQRTAGIMTSKPITIGKDVWIGANCVICGGVTIGDGAVIGAGSIVTKDIPANVIAVGNPCRVMRPITEADRVTVD